MFRYNNLWVGKYGSNWMNPATWSKYWAMVQFQSSSRVIQVVSTGSIGSVWVVFSIPLVTERTWLNPILLLCTGQLLLLPNTLLNPKIPIIYFLHSEKAAPFLYSSLFLSLCCFFFLYYFYIHFYLLLLKFEALLKAKIN